MPARKRDPKDFIIPQSQLITETSDKLHLVEKDVERVIKAYEAISMQHILEASETKITMVEVLKSIRLTGTLVPEHYHEHPYSKDPVFVDDAIRLSTSYTRSFRAKMTREYRKSRALLKQWYNSRTPAQIEAAEKAQERMEREENEEN